MEARLDRPEGDPEGRRHVGQRQPQVVVQDDDRAPGSSRRRRTLSTSSRAAMSPECVRQQRRVDVGELDLDDPALAASCEVDAGVDDQPMQPGIEPVGFAKARKVPPGPDESVLDRVACELRVPEDQAGRPVQPHDGRAGELGEGVMIALPRALDEPSLVHGRLGDGATSLVAS